MSDQKERARGLNTLILEYMNLTDEQWKKTVCLGYIGYIGDYTTSYVMWGLY